jgi:hypothetical protein
VPLGLRVEHALGVLGTRYGTRAVSGDPFPPAQPVDAAPCPHHRLRRSREWSLVAASWQAASWRRRRAVPLGLRVEHALGVLGTRYSTTHCGET